MIFILVVDFFFFNWIFFLSFIVSEKFLYFCFKHGFLISLLLVVFYSDISRMSSVFFSVDVPEKKDDEIESTKKEEEVVEKTEGTIKHLHVSL